MPDSTSGLTWMTGSAAAETRQRNRTPRRAIMGFLLSCGWAFSHTPPECPISFGSGYIPVGPIPRNEEMLPMRTLALLALALLWSSAAAQDAPTLKLEK